MLSKPATIVALFSFFLCAQILDGGVLVTTDNEEIAFSSIGLEFLSGQSCVDSLRIQVPVAEIAYAFFVPTCGDGIDVLLVDRRSNRVAYLSGVFQRTDSISVSGASPDAKEVLAAEVDFISFLGRESSHWENSRQPDEVTIQLISGRSVVLESGNKINFFRACNLPPAQSSVFGKPCKWSEQPCSRGSESVLLITPERRTITVACDEVKDTSLIPWPELGDSWNLSARTLEEQWQRESRTKSY